jgi:hypothetical protein
MKTLASSALALVACFVARTAAADTCPVMEGAPGLARTATEERLAYLARAFDREVHDVDTWSWTWGSIYTAGVVAESVALGITTNHGTRTDLTVGVIATAVGAASLYGLPLKLTLPLRAARRHWDDPDACAVLARAERTLVNVEANQRLATGILPHLGNVAANAAIALILGVGYGRWSSAAISAGVGLAIGETNAFTQPHHLSTVLTRYRSGQLDGPDVPPPSVSWAIAPVLTRRMSGAALVLQW